MCLGQLIDGAFVTAISLFFFLVQLNGTYQPTPMPSDCWVMSNASYVVVIQLDCVREKEKERGKGFIRCFIGGWNDRVTSSLQQLIQWMPLWKSL